MPDPQVSVILPIYNAARFVREAVASVLSQSWTDLELIAIDDGSEDASACEFQQAGDCRSSLIRQEHRGPAAARNTGLRLARGRYIAFMDGDDLWLPGKLEQDVAFLDAHPEADLVFSSMRIVDEFGNGLGRTIRKWSGAVTIRDLLIEDIIGTPTVLMRREAVEQIGDFDESMPAGSDYDYWLRAALLRPNRLYGVPRVSALYRRHPGQISADWQEQLEFWMRIMAKMRAICPEELAQVERLAGAGIHRALAATAYENGDSDDALRLFQQALRTAPMFLLSDRRTWLLGSALVSALVLPRRVHQKLERLARTARASRD
ncbi:MAG TPA: glycosyltransferase [Bryobacteraceae bacterium]|nr:glycosyltransferase [Bryobacteraceae bacterium]